MIEKPEFLSNRGKVVIAIVVIVVIGAGIYWFNQSPGLQEKVNGFNPLQPPQTIQANEGENPSVGTVPENPIGAGTSQPDAVGDGTSQQNPDGDSRGGTGGSGGSSGGDDGSGGDEGEGEVVIEGNCEESEGRICDEGKTCDGSILSTLDTDQCCFGKCV